MSTPGQLFNFGGSSDNNGLFGGGQGQNQYGTFPSVGMPTAGLTMNNQTPGIPTSVGAPGAPGASSAPGGSASNPTGGLLGRSGTAPSINSQNYGVKPLDPQLTQNLFNFLNSQVGNGVPSFDWSSILPSSGQATQNGQLSAPQNQLLQALMSSFGQPGGTMNQMVNTGDPTDVGPAWQAMLQAEQQNIQKNEAQLQEHFSAAGNLVGSPYGTAEAQYQSQTAADQNAQLTQAQQQAQEQAKGRMLTADQLQSGLAQYIQSLDQASIDRLYQEFQRVSPQNNPLLQSQMAAATTFPPTIAKKQGGGLAGLVGTLAGGLGNLDTTGSSSGSEQLLNFVGGL